MGKFKTPSGISAGLRHCPCCKGIIPASNFNRDRQRPDGLRLYCRPCDRYKALSTQRRRRDLIGAGKRMTDSNATPAERLAASIAALACPQPYAAAA